MKKKILALLILITLGFQKYIFFSVDAASLNFHKENLSSYESLKLPNDKIKIENFWNAENISFLTTEEADIFNTLKIKATEGKNLTIQERDILSELRREVIQRKLGEPRFERYKKLIEKREKQEKGLLEIPLTKEEKAEIYSFEKEIRGK